ncbi:hypothetical protein AAA451_11810 [Staphylococcus equorum]
MKKQKLKLSTLIIIVVCIVVLFSLIITSVLISKTIKETIHQTTEEKAEVIGKTVAQSEIVQSTLKKVTMITAYKRMCLKYNNQRM